MSSVQAQQASDSTVAVELLQSSLHTFTVPAGIESSTVEDALHTIICTNGAGCDVLAASSQRRRRGLSSQWSFAVSRELQAADLLDEAPVVSRGTLADILGASEQSIVISTPSVTGL